MRPHGRLLRSIPVFLLAISSALMMGGCQGGADGVRVELSTQQASWRRELDTLRAQQTSLRERFGRQRPAVTAAIGPSGQAVAARLQAALDGAAQSVVDLESQARQAAEQVETALATGAEQGRHALDGARERVNPQVAALSSDVTALIAEVDNFGKLEPVRTTQNETGVRR